MHDHRGATAFKQIEIKMENTMKIDLWSSLLMISINDPTFENKVQVIKIECRSSQEVWLHKSLQKQK